MNIPINYQGLNLRQISVLSRLLILGLLLLTFNLHADELTDEAQRLLDNNQPGEAYTLLYAEIEERAGTPDYDLLLGIAALDSNHPTQAVFAFERVLSIDPENSRARLELARAYFELNENEAAREEFTYARSLEIPAEVNATIEEYLTVIDSRIRAAEQQRQFNAYLETSLGYDSNVNSATDASTIALPAFGNLVFTLDSTSRELDSGFYNVEGGMSFSTRILPRNNLSLFGGANLFYRPTWDEHNFDTAAGNVQLGLRRDQGNNSFLASLQGQKFLINEDTSGNQGGLNTSRNQGGLDLQWLHMPSQRTQISVFTQGLIQRFPGQTIRDVNQYTGGIGYVHLIASRGSPVIFGSVYAGIDDERDDTRTDIGRTFFGIRGGIEISLREDLNYIGSISYQYSKYGADDPLFQERRKDNFLFLRGGVEYTFNENWVITPEVRYLLNDSSLVINEFNRWQVFASARYNF